MRKTLALTTVFLALFISGCINEAQPENQVCIRGKCFDVELAVTPEERSSGLMGRSHLDTGKGMLFVFDEEGNHSFWMKDMRFALDIIWISADRDIVYVSSYTQPCEVLKPCPSITPPEKAKYVLEINAGKAYEFEVGDKFTFSGDF
jgi:uncharacterized membrane protein (UPF0127 family)